MKNVFSPKALQTSQRLATTTAQAAPQPPLGTKIPIRAATISVGSGCWACWDWPGYADDIVTSCERETRGTHRAA
jgi:hypothetical protein